MTTSATAISDSSTAAQLEQVSALVFPTRRDEAWRYAPHDVLARLSFGPPSGSAESGTAVGAGQMPTLDGPLVVIVNGVVDDAGSDFTALADGLRLSPLSDHPHDPSGSITAHFNSDADSAVDAYVTLNRTFGVNGVFIDVAEGHQIAAPIHIVNVVIPGQTPNTSCSGVVVHVGAGSSATVVETRIGVGQEFGGLNIRTTITLDADATLDHLLLQDLPATQVQLSRVEVTQQAGSTFRARSYNLGAAYGRVGYDVHLAGDQAHADLSGLYYGTGDQTLDQQITVIHDAKDSTSRQSYRGVLDGKSTGVFNGGIDVRPGADGTDAQQSNDNLLLSNNATANTQPRLEILADDVACKHGATVGQLDETALYYLRTRGIPQADAHRLLINAFAEQSVEGVSLDVVSAWIKDRIGTADA